MGFIVTRAPGRNCLQRLHGANLANRDVAGAAQRKKSRTPQRWKISREPSYEA